ncbi:family 20 glycosylhydrolase [Telluribacter sp. SYSU D00476]|uniref:family 20 glycosylhydrolase n=1 Tax=Telluribacter sp. SYSU D00476 TaxID=2811430 RepID=UPI001FF2369B|nr:family 20 glycosylhydrolase [Telluribacter sp. SYSU D00476]
MKHLVLLLFILFNSSLLLAQGTTPDSLGTVRGFCIAAPTPAEHARFLTFIEKELAPRGVNTLVLRVDYNYQFKSHPELRDPSALSPQQVKQMVQLCKKYGIELIPQINLLGHQSWANTTHNLLRVYPQFDETPHVTMPEKYEWPNADGLYCKSYCPLHPEVHGVVFSMVDEIMDAFEAKSFHAGMDEVFYIGDDKCPRCGGRDKAELFAGEITRIRNHLAQKGRRLWIWGDRLLDAKATGLGMWEASMNNTHRAVDMIPKDVVICDWHYNRAEPTAAYFTMKGFDVITCPWNKPAVATAQYEAFKDFRATANPTLAPRYRGLMQTVWSGAGNFMDIYYNTKPVTDPNQKGPIDSFVQLFQTMNSSK